MCCVAGNGARGQGHSGAAADVEAPSLQGRVREGTGSEHTETCDKAEEEAPERGTSPCGQGAAAHEA